MVGQGAGQVADGIALARPRRPVEEKALLERHPEALEFAPSLRESDHVALEGGERGLREDDLLCSHRLEPMDRNADRATGILWTHLEGQDLATIGAGLCDGSLEALEERPRSVAAFAALGHRDLHLADAGAKREDVWSILPEEGILICKGRPAGYIRTEADYTNYVLKLEWRFNPVTKLPGNSGVLLRMVGQDKVWPKSVEAQLQSRNAGDFWNIEDFKMKTDPARRDPKVARHTFKMKTSNEKPLGEWNTYRIIVKGGDIKLYVNDELQNEATEVE